MAKGKTSRSKSSSRVTRASDPAAVQMLAYMAARRELRKVGVAWTNVDTRRLRQALGLAVCAEEQKARRVLAELQRVLRTRGVRSALCSACALADEHRSAEYGTIGSIALLAGIDGPLRWLRDFAEGNGGSIDDDDVRWTLREYAVQEIGWWSREPLTARTLALLSVLAGIPSWREAEGKRPGEELSGRDALAAERRAMAHRLKHPPFSR
jgi:hypothetical protein